MMLRSTVTILLLFVVDMSMGISLAPLKGLFTEGVQSTKLEIPARIGSWADNTGTIVKQKIQKQALKLETWCLLPAFKDLLGRYVCKDTGLGSAISQAIHPTSTVTSRRATSAVVARQATSGSGGSISSSCDPSDVACNYCALAVNQVNMCNSTITNLGLTQNSLSDCLCYKNYTDPTDGPFFAWAPNYLDAALRACPDYARTADTAYYQAWTSVQNFCHAQGDYWTMGLTDTATYQLAIATAGPSASTTRSGVNPAVVTASPTGAVVTTTPTSNAAAVSQGSDVTALHLANSLIVVLSIIFAMLS